MVLVPMICFRLVPLLKTRVGSVLQVFYNFHLSVKCVSVLLEYLLNLVTLNSMLLIKVCIVYHDVFVGGTNVFDQVGQPSEFAV